MCWLQGINLQQEVARGDIDRSPDLAVHREAVEFIKREEITVMAGARVSMKDLDEKKHGL